MDYVQPEVLVLGLCVEAIQNSYIKGPNQFDGQTHQLTAVVAAYDIDE